MPKDTKYRQSPEGLKPIKTRKPREKKPRTEAQIEATNRMRVSLMEKRENDTKIKALAQLEHEEMKKKIKKLSFSSKVKQEVNKKIKEIASESYDSDSSSEDEIIVVKKKSKVPTVVQEIKPKPIKQSTQPISQPKPVEKRNSITFY